MLNEQEYFERFVGLVGHSIRIGRRSTGEEIVGCVLNAMFDSFIMETPDGPQVISFTDLSYLDEAGDGE